MEHTVSKNIRSTSSSLNTDLQSHVLLEESEVSRERWKWWWAQEWGVALYIYSYRWTGLVPVPIWLKVRLIYLKKVFRHVVILYWGQFPKNFPKYVQNFFFFNFVNRLEGRSVFVLRFYNEIRHYLVQFSRIKIKETPK